MTLGPPVFHAVLTGRAAGNWAGRSNIAAHPNGRTTLSQEDFSQCEPFHIRPADVELALRRLLSNFARGNLFRAVR